jgi:hypothetical protein
LLSWSRPQMPENRDPLCIWFHGSTLWAVSSSRQSTHTRIPTVPEKRAMPMITRVFMSLQTLPSTSLVLFFLRFSPETLLVLVLVRLEKIRRSRPLILDMPHLFFYNITFFFFLGLIARISLFILGLVA